MFLARIGSLNGLVQTRPGSRLRKWLGGEAPSARTIGRVFSAMDIQALRDNLRRHYYRRRRNKNLKPFVQGLRPVVFDGHESTASYRRCCRGCHRRRVKTEHGERIQYYHRYVLAILLHGEGALLLDVEDQKPGEGEPAAAIRLLERLLDNYPRAFNMVGGDNLYLNPDFCSLAVRRGKYFQATLKNEKRDLLKDARGLFTIQTPQAHRDNKRRYLLWDIEGFTSWQQFDHPVRVVRSVETSWVRRQLTGQIKKETSEWVWATNLPASLAATRAIVKVGHGRWGIENNGFNELVNQWHADHVYKHNPRAMLAFLLLLLLAYNIFHAMVSLNVKRQLRRKHTKLHFAKLIAAEFYSPPNSGFT